MAKKNNEINAATLTNLRSVRSITSDMTLEQLEKAVANMSKVFEEQKILVESEKKAQQERQARLDAIIAQMKEDGITEEELAAYMKKTETKQPKARKKYAKRPAKYEYVNGKGEVKTWTGQGRTPSVIAKALENGKSLADFEIEEIAQAA
ncbi:H-NS family nucleoid-associated regulatory protein [Vibrio parahaemolyticus]|nr:H-NS family nucleoid-associated regulatory protein [Vibrio parahaemolyticus]